MPDDETQAAARELESKLHVSVPGISPDDQRKRLQALRQLAKSFQGYDPSDELKALQEEDGF